MLFRVLGNKWLRLAVLLLILAALAHQVSLVVWQLVPAQQQGAIEPLVDASRNSTDGAVNNRQNFQQLATAIGRANLFGKDEVRAVVPVVEEDAPETQLNYKLRGTYYSPDDRLSVAIIEVKPNQSQHYMVNEELDDNITLTAIKADYVLLSRYGKIERLNLEKRDDGEGQSFAVADERTAANQTALLRSYKKRYASNPMALATRFQAIPVEQDGRNIGFKLKALRGERLLDRLNIEPDDVFTSVNGTSLENPFEALDALKSLITAERVTVTILRNGAEQTLDFQI